MTEIRTRFAPSPTGYLHLGGIRTALFSWLYARRHGGTFVLRVEDTDRERSTDEAVAIILDGMAWLGLDADEGPYYQTRRMDRYREVLDSMLASGHAYYCYCSKDELETMRAEAMARGDKPRYDGRCRERHEAPTDYTSRVVRFRNPLDGEVIIEDLIQGRVVYRNSELDDLILARADGSPTYNFTVVVDDIDMRITHVIRGDDHLNNTPRQMNIMAALGADLPSYAHIPLILGEDGRKLSKRHGTASVLDYREHGILPEALLNYLVRLGWSHGDQEIFSRDEMTALFDLVDVNKSAAAINPEKLLWLNQHYLKIADDSRLAELAIPHFERQGLDVSAGPPLPELCAIQKLRVKTLEELVEQSHYFYEDFASHNEAAAAKFLTAAIREPLAALREAFEQQTDWSAPALHGAIENVAARFDLKLGKLAQPLRVAVTGTTVSPSIDITLALLGRQRVVDRLGLALTCIDSHS